MPPTSNQGSLLFSDDSGESLGLAIEEEVREQRRKRQPGVSDISGDGAPPADRPAKGSEKKEAAEGEAGTET
jgi:hypothetical protein